MAGGYTGKILRVNLTSGNISVDEPDETFYRRYVGGAGFVSYFLLKEVPKRVDALSPENKLVFANGPITATMIQGGARNCVGAKSPLTDAFGKSEVSGYWGAELKRAGFDALIVEGRAERPVYIWVHDGEAEIRDAARLWGLPTKETQEAIRAELGDRLIRTALIGPAGENMVRFAAVINDVASHSAGRGGLGAVLGSKNLKGIAARGRQAPKVADPAAVRGFVRWMANRENMMSRPSNALMHLQGTGGGWIVVDGHNTGNLPIRNFGDGLFEKYQDITFMSPENQTLRIGNEGCYGCAIECKKVTEIKEGPFIVDRAYGGPEYETQAAFASDCGVDDIRAMIKAHELCAAYGMDTISCGCTVAFAMECFEKGILTLADTGGLDLHFGNAESMVKLTEMIAKREGIGDVLAEGTRGAARRIGKGAEQYALHVKGLEIPMHEPRLKQGLGLTYAIEAIGADHCAAIHDTGFDKETPGLAMARTFGVNYEPLPVNDLSPAKVRLAIDHHLRSMFLDSVVLCSFVQWNPDELVDIMTAVTGWNYSLVEALRVGERVMTMSRAFNVREGLTTDDDWLPERFFHPTPRGPLQETAIDKDAFHQAIQYWYRMGGWTALGVPTREKMVELGVGWVAEDLELPSFLEEMVPMQRLA